jgi:nitroreductase
LRRSPYQPLKLRWQTHTANQNIMLNDYTTAATLLATRRSGKPRDMIMPGPDEEQLRNILETAIRVPDHGKLAPWRLVNIKPDQRDRLAALLITAYRAEKPGASFEEAEAMAQFAYHAPTLIIVLSTPIPDSKIPIWEQELSAGALCMNMLIATHAAGFVGSWITGWASYNPLICDAFHGEGGRIAGFIFIGTPARELEERARPHFDTIIKNW